MVHKNEVSVASFACMLCSSGAEIWIWVLTVYPVLCPENQIFRYCMKPGNRSMSPSCLLSRRPYKSSIISRLSGLSENSIVCHSMPLFNTQSSSLFVIHLFIPVHMHDLACDARLVVGPYNPVSWAVSLINKGQYYLPDCDVTFGASWLLGLCI